MIQDFFCCSSVSWINFKHSKKEVFCWNKKVPQISDNTHVIHNRLWIDNWCIKKKEKNWKVEEKVTTYLKCTFRKVLTLCASHYNLHIYGWNCLRTLHLQTVSKGQLLFLLQRLQNYPISGKITKSYQIHGMFPNRDLKSPLHLSLSIHKVFLLFLPQMVVSQLNLKIK